MKNTLDAMNEVRDTVNTSASRLYSLASAFRRTGNADVAEQLEFEADTISASVKPLHSAWNADMDIQMGHSDAMMGNLLNMAINCNIKPLGKD